MIITMKWLRREDACDLDKYASFVGDGVELTGAVVLAAHNAGLLNADWLAERVLTAEALAEYDHAKAPAVAEYQCATADAWAKYQHVTAPTWAEYDRAKAQAMAEYERVKAPALAEYQRATAPILAQIVDAPGSLAA